MNTENETRRSEIYNEYTRHEAGFTFIWKCKTCGSTIKKEGNLTKHLKTDTHRNHEANSYFWKQRSKQYLNEPFQSLLTPNLTINRE